MAYNKDFPADDSYLADFPSNEREQIRAIVEDKIVNAGKVNGLTTSNDSGQVPVSNGTVNTNLNADMLDGHHSEYFSPSGHSHNNASTSSDGFMSAADKTKLDGVATGAEVNQNAFGNVAVGDTTLQAGNKQDTLYINAGNNISIAADAANDKITIGLSGIVPMANNADQVDGYHESSFLRYRASTYAAGEDTLWNQIGIKEYYNVLPKGISGTYNWGAVVSLPGSNTRLDIWYNHHCSANGDGLWYRSGFGTDQHAWAQLIDSNNYTNYAPTKTGAGATGTWPVSVSGNAGTATKLATQRTISVSGTGLTAAGQAFDGTGDITIPITLANALLALAGVAPSAGMIPVFTGANTASLASITDFMKTLLGKASADDVRSAIGAVNASGAGVVAGDVSNANAWWVKLGGTIPLIIQGGNGSVGRDQTATFTYPVAFPSAALGAFLGRAYSGDEISPTITSLQKSYMQWTSKGEDGHSYGAKTFFTVIGY